MVEVAWWWWRGGGGMVVVCWRWRGGGGVVEAACWRRRGGGGVVEAAWRVYLVVVVDSRLEDGLEIGARFLNLPQPPIGKRAPIERLRVARLQVEHLPT